VLGFLPLGRVIIERNSEAQPLTHQWLVPIPGVEGSWQWERRFKIGNDPGISSS
jgi:hypothetical protein